jgi:hypothetical protein
MRKIILGLAVGVMGLVLAGTVDAHPAHFRAVSPRPAVHYEAHRVRVNCGPRFVRRENHHWTRHARYHR